jgi:hypothetical protein
MQAIEFEATAQGHKLNLPENIADGTELRVLLLMKDNIEPVNTIEKKYRQPHPDIKGKIKINGDIFESSPSSDWDSSL